MTDGRGIIPARALFKEDELRQYFETHLTEFPLMSFDQAREVVAARPKLQQRKWGDYITMLRSKAVIEWTRADLRRAYMDGLTQRANASN